MSDVQVYVKTPKGIEEVNSRSRGLPQRARHMLIMMDGKRTPSNLEAVVPQDERAALLESLVAGGFVVPLLSSSAVTISGKPIEKFPPPQNAEQRFEMAKNLIRNTLNAFLGGMGSGLINQIDKCTSLDELRVLYKAWREAIILTSDGRKQAKDLENRLAALLS